MVGREQKPGRRRKRLREVSASTGDLLLLPPRRSDSSNWKPSFVMLSWVFFAGRAELWRLRCDSALTVGAVLRIPEASSHRLALEAQNFLCRRPKHFGLQGSEVPKEFSCSLVWVAALHRPSPALAVGDWPGCSKGSTARSRWQGQRRRLPAFGGASLALCTAGA